MYGRGLVCSVECIRKTTCVYGRGLVFSVYCIGETTCGRGQVYSVPIV